MLFGWADAGAMPAQWRVGPQVTEATKRVFGFVKDALRARAGVFSTIFPVSRLDVARTAEPR
jgi:hypothetical protein